MPSTIQRALHVLSHVIFTAILWETINLSEVENGDRGRNNLCQAHSQKAAEPGQRHKQRRVGGRSQVEFLLSEMPGTRSASDFRCWDICIYIMRHLGDGTQV